MTSELAITQGDGVMWGVVRPSPRMLSRASLQENRTRFKLELLVPVIKLLQMNLTYTASQ